MVFEIEIYDLMGDGCCVFIIIVYVFKDYGYWYFWIIERGKVNIYGIVLKMFINFSSVIFFILINGK